MLSISVTIAIFITVTKSKFVFLLPKYSVTLDLFTVTSVIKVGPHVGPTWQWDPLDDVTMSLQVRPNPM